MGLAGIGVSMPLIIIALITPAGDRTRQVPQGKSLPKVICEEARPAKATITKWVDIGIKLTIKPTAGLVRVPEKTSMALKRGTPRRDGATYTSACNSARTLPTAIAWSFMRRKASASGGKIATRLGSCRTTDSIFSRRIIDEPLARI